MFIKTYEDFSKKQSAFVIRTERVAGVAPKKFENGRYLHFYVRIFIDVPESNRNSDRFYSIEDINLVKYELHPSYTDRNRISEDRRNNFELRIWAYGFFTVKATVLLRMAQSLELSGEVRWPVTDEERRINKGEVS